MPTKLKNLKVTKVDFVDEGANPDASIQLFKRREPTKTKETIQKDGAASFKEKYTENEFRKIMDEICDVCYALQASFYSILYDHDLEDGAAKESAMQDSLAEFDTAVSGAIQQWASGKPSNIVVKGVSAETDDEDEKEDRDGRKRRGKGEGEMKIDKSKLTDDEIELLNSLIAKATRQSNQSNPLEDDEEEDDEKKTAESKPKRDEKGTKIGKATIDEDIYKGIHPAVRAELESLRKFREDAEDKELHEIAKKYVVIGKKEEDLVPMLKNMKAAGGSAYDDMIAVLDSAVDMVEQSGLFSEIGKSGHGDSTGESWAQAEAKAIELMKSKTGLTKAQALDEVFMTDPKLAKECEEEG